MNDYLTKNKFLLKGIKILLFSSAILEKELIIPLESYGAYCKTYNLYKIIPKSIKYIKPYIDNLYYYDYLIITSRNALNILISFMNKLSISIKNIPKVIVIGKKSKLDCQRKGINPYLVPKTFSVEGLIQSLKKFNFKKKTFFLVKSNLTKNYIKNFLKSKEAFLTELVLYENIQKILKVKDFKFIKNFKPTYIIFTSSSSVNYYVEQFGTKINSKIISIGKSTENTLKKKGFKKIITSKYSSSEEIINCIINDSKKII